MYHYEDPVPPLSPRRQIRAQRMSNRSLQRGARDAMYDATEQGVVVHQQQHQPWGMQQHQWTEFQQPQYNTAPQYTQEVYHYNDQYNEQYAAPHVSQYPQGMTPTLPNMYEPKEGNKATRMVSSLTNKLKRNGSVGNRPRNYYNDYEVEDYRQEASSPRRSNDSPRSIRDRIPSIGLPKPSMPSMPKNLPRPSMPSLPKPSMPSMPNLRGSIPKPSMPSMPKKNLFGKRAKSSHF